MQPEFDKKTQSFAKLKWEVPNDSNSNGALDFLKSNSVDGYLQPKKILSWFQRHIDLVKEKLTLPPHVLSVSIFSLLSLAVEYC